MTKVLPSNVLSKQLLIHPKLRSNLQKATFLYDQHDETKARNIIILRYKQKHAKSIKKIKIGH